MFNRKPRIRKTFSVLCFRSGFTEKRGGYAIDNGKQIHAASPYSKSIQPNTNGTEEETQHDDKSIGR